MPALKKPLIRVCVHSGIRNLTFLEYRHQMAVYRVRAALEKDAAYSAITPADTGKRLKDCKTIWRKTVDTPSRSWVVDVGLPPLFPDEVPIAYLPAWDEVYLKNLRRNKHGHWPLRLIIRHCD